MEVSCGIDWAEDHHDIAVVDRDGQLLARRRISDDAADLAVLLALLAEPNRNQKTSTGHHPAPSRPPAPPIPGAQNARSCSGGSPNPGTRPPLSGDRRPALLTDAQAATCLSRSSLITSAAFAAWP